MKLFNILALTASAVLMAVAFAGAPSAFAESTALCKVDESPCASGNQLNSGHETTVGKAKLLTSLGTVECNALVELLTKSGLANPRVSQVTATFSECALGGSSCTATEENGPAEAILLKEGHETAKVTGAGLVHLVCGSSLNCSYNGVGLVGTAKGPLLSTQTNGEISLSEQSLNKEAGGFLCPKTTKVDVTFTPLSAAYISS